MKKEDLINEVWDFYSNSRHYMVELDLITGSCEADLLSDAVFLACKKRTIPQLRELLKELKEVSE